MSADQLFGDDDKGPGPDDADASKITMVNDPNAIANITGAFGSLGIIEDQAPMLVDYNGSNIDPEDAEVLEHIVEGFSDHLGRRDNPNFTFMISNFDDLGSNETYKAKDDGPGSKFNASVSCNYTINDKTVTSDYFAMDNIYFEAVSITSKEGVPAKNHGTSWMNIYLSRAGAKQFVNKFSDDVGWAIKATMFTVDTRQGLASLRVSLDDEAPPGWTTMMIPEPDDDDQSIELKQCGIKSQHNLDCRIKQSNRRIILSLLVSPSYQQHHTSFVAQYLLHLLPIVVSFHRMLSMLC